MPVPTPSSHAVMTALAVFGLSLFLNLLLFFALPQSNALIATSIVSGLLGFIGGSAMGPKLAGTINAPDATVNTGEPKP